MEYKAVKCPTCGSLSIVETKKEAVEGNIYYYYKCNSCLDEFNTKKISNKKISNDGNELSAKDIFKNNIDKIIEIKAYKDNIVKSGTGIMLGDGYILTNKHVICDYKENDSLINLCLCDYYKGEGKSTGVLNLEFVYASKVKDIALMKCENLNSCIKFAQNKVETGDQVYAIGNSRGYGLCIVDGLVSDCERVVEGVKYIMVSAPTTNGNSGGPLLNSKGELIGMITAGDSTVQTMNYAIPLSDIIAFLKKFETLEGIKIFNER